MVVVVEVVVADVGTVVVPDGTVVVDDVEGTLVDVVSEVATVGAAVTRNRASTPADATDATNRRRIDVRGGFLIASTYRAPRQDDIADEQHAVDEVLFILLRSGDDKRPSIVEP
jgi:hypothetical protein